MADKRYIKENFEQFIKQFIRERNYATDEKIKADTEIETETGTETGKLPDNQVTKE